MVNILYLAHDLDDSAIWRRVSMMEAGGGVVTVAGFRRGTGPLPRPVRVLGVTRNGLMGQRLRVVLRAVLRARQSFGDLPRPDVIVARNLEMLVLARRLQGLWGGDAALVYEVLDIHRMMLGSGVRARAMRAVERAFMRRVGVLVTSSPGFLRAYFTPHGQIGAATAVRLVENKINGFGPPALTVPMAAIPSAVPTIGWFGILRCAASLACLDAVTRATPGRMKVVLAGRPALDAIPDFHAVVAANPDLEFKGSYRNPDDLPQLYGAVHLAWLVDRYDAGSNSDWLLPNRLYEGCLFGAVPIALAGTEVARRLDEMAIGVVLPETSVDDVAAFVGRLDPERLASLAAAVRMHPKKTWLASVAEATELVCALARMPVAASVMAGERKIALKGVGR